MNIKAIALVTTAFSLFALEAYAQANHNTTRSNRKSGGIAAPADTNTPTPVGDVKTKSAAGATVGRVTLVRQTDTSGDNTVTGCVMFSGAPDENCDGVADGKRMLDNRTDIEANTSAVFDNRTDIDANTAAVADNRTDINANTSAAEGREIEAPVCDQADEAEKKACIAGGEYGGKVSVRWSR